MWRSIACLVLTLATPAAADPMPCAPFGPISAVVQSTGVARVEIVKVQPMLVELTVIDQIAGSTPKVLRGGTACRSHLQVGDLAIVINKEAYLDPASETILSNTDPRLDIVFAIAHVTSTEDRKRELLRAIVRGSDADASAAALYLAQSPVTLDSLTGTERRTLMAAARRPTRELLFVLARLRIQLKPKTYERFGLTGSLVQRIAGIRDYESILDAAKLADLILSEPDVAHQFAAFERCDRVRKPRFPLVYMRDLSASTTFPAATLARMCRTQVPVGPPIPYPSSRPPMPPPPLRAPTVYPPPPIPMPPRPRAPRAPAPSPVQSTSRDTDLINPY